MRFLLVALLAPTLLPAQTIDPKTHVAPGMVRLADVEGQERTPLKAARGELAAVFFVSHDCPISNFYSQEIRRICQEYGERGLRCSLVYIDPTLSDEAARKHAAEYSHGAY